MTAFTGPELRSTVTAEGELRLDLVDVDVGEPGPDEIVIRVEAAPINPSDLGLLTGPADLSTLKASGTADRPVLIATIPEKIVGALKARHGQSMAVGNEGAGTVVAAGSNVAHLMGKLVGMMGGGMYTTYRRLPAKAVTPLPEGATAADGASMFVNPLTALAFVETMRMEEHTALIHTAAASNLGQMLNKICLADGISIVNIVRSEEQAQILRAIGAKHIVNSEAADFRAALTDAVAETGATLGFDAIGGGTLAGTILSAIEAASSRNATEYSRYGSDSPKQVYIYGALDTGPTVLNRNFGLTWDLGGWLLTPFMKRAGAEVVGRMRKRVVDELTTTFASHYSNTISLAQMLDADTLQAYQRKGTGNKYLVNPTL